MNIKELIVNINKSVEDLDLVTARKYIEENLELLNKNKNLLKGNARDLLNFITHRLESGHETLTREEMATVHAINLFASKFDLRSLKLAIKNKEKLLLKKDFVAYLNSDAKIVLKGMGAIEQKENINY